MLRLWRSPNTKLQLGLIPALIAAVLVPVIALTLVATPETAEAEAPVCGTAVPAEKTALVADCTALLSIKRFFLAGKPSGTDENGNRVRGTSPNGPAVEKLDTWGPDKPIADWYGVTVYKDRVRRIHLPSTRYKESTTDKKTRSILTGTLPEGIGELTALRQLNLSGNNMVGPIPKSIGKLKYLKQLNLAGNDMTGRIPAGLGQLRLNTLILKNNEFEKAFPTFDHPGTLKVVRINKIPDLKGCYPAVWSASGHTTTAKTAESLKSDETAIDACP